MDKHVLLTDLKQGNADAAAKEMDDAGLKVTTAVVDVESRAQVHVIVIGQKMLRLKRQDDIDIAIMLTNCSTAPASPLN